MLRTAFCERLIACLTWLKDTQNDPIPHHLESQFITDVDPLVAPRFEPDTEQLCNYCLALANALARRCPKGGRLIAGALGVAPEEIWPSRYCGW
ncbi:helix-turn-helix domain-containing protein [Leminorella grimontii]|uniref:helix-turn-helix domain-containing protein n=1 Tax=Leminorella grimontii TaxID=82981 RepID=UPI00207DDA52|nr:helix-turn-helix domain-containing protein [Leminorella grimontii]GKX59582.1 hypothetical protein SOASR031_18970 [Leminorella grimontii]